MVRALLISLAFVSACQKDETLTGYGAADAVWVLQSIDEKPFNATATITFPAEGKIAGRAPCNSYGGDQTVPYPWFKAEAIRSTKLACTDLKKEQLFFSSLRAMTLSEVSGNVLALSNEKGQLMEFRAK